MTDSLERFLEDLRFDVPAGLADRAKAAAAVDQRETQRQPWAMTLVAALIALAVVVALVFTARALHPKAIAPVNPVPFAGVPSARCDTYPSGSGGQGPLKMVSSTTGWVGGPLRTTDGGAHWLDVSPPSIANRSAGTAEFYLDATHAWVAETGGSSKACEDHVVTFSTSDGGRSWQKGATIPVNPSAPTDVIWEGSGPSQWIFFADPRTGWLLIESGPASMMAPIWNRGALYRTTDAGLHWNLVSRDPGAAAFKGAKCFVGDGMTVVPPTTIWLSDFCPSGSGAPASLLVTRDGGISWQLQALPMTVYETPTALDSMRATVRGDGGLLVTSDGGVTWVVRALPAGAFSVEFINPDEGWVLTTTSLYRTSDGGVTWSRLGPGLPVDLNGGGDLSFVFLR